MGDRWAAVISVSADKEKRLAPNLETLGLTVRSGSWDGELPSAGPDAPLLAVFPLEDYPEKCARLAWYQPPEKPPLTVLLAPSTLSSAVLQFQLQHGIFSVIADALCDDAACLLRTLRGWIAPAEMFDLRTFGGAAAQIERFAIETLADKHQVAEEVVSYARPYRAAQGHLRDIRLIVNELINNALFHSFRDLDGQEKYSARRFISLESSERVFMEAAVSDDAIVLAVEDNSGTISPQNVLKYMLRQTSGEGVYDSHGRGFYLITNLTDHLSICLETGRRTRVVAMIHAGTEPRTPTLNFFIG